MASFDTTDLWDMNAIVDTLFPIYLQGVVGVSYYECKITNNGQDAGFVLVNANGTDIPIVQSAMVGKTLTEELLMINLKTPSELLSNAISYDYFITRTSGQSIFDKETIVYRDDIELGKRYYYNINQESDYPMSFVEMWAYKNLIFCEVYLNDKKLDFTYYPKGSNLTSDIYLRCLEPTVVMVMLGKYYSGLSLG